MAERGSAKGKGGEAVRAAHLYRQLEIEEREKEEGEQDKMRTEAAAMDESTLEWEKADERTAPRTSDEA